MPSGQPKERDRRRERLPGLAGMVRGMAIRAERGETELLAVIHGVKRLAAMIDDRPELAEVVEFSSTTPRVTPEETERFLHGVERRHGLRPDCFQCNGTKHQDPALGTSPCPRCQGTGREA